MPSSARNRRPSATRTTSPPADGAAPRDFHELAVLTGKPAFAQALHVGRPNLGNPARLRERFEDILARRWFTNNGCYVRQFEAAIAELTGVEHCIAMCNATIALEILARAVGLSGEVIVPSFTFIATAHCLQWQQITPVFCDIDRDTHTLSPARVEALITPRTTGILATHIWGRACQVEALADIAERRGLRLIFDAAHALACSHRGRMIGGFGDAEVFSFHATKFVNSFEGGAVVTNDADLAARIRLMKNFGFAGEDNVCYIGTNGKMNEVSAAMGLTCLEELPGIVEVNRQNYEHYRAARRPAGRFARRIQPDGAVQLPVRGAGNRPGGGQPRPGRPARRAPRRECAGAAILLSWLPPHGAVPFLFPARIFVAARHGMGGVAGVVPAHGDRGFARGNRQGSADHPLGGGQCRGGPPRLAAGKG